MTATLHAPTARRSREPLRISPGVALFVIWTGGAAALALWWKNTPFVIGLDGWLTNAGRLTGLLAGYLVVVLLALMARVPALERGVGTDRLAHWHAMIGRYTVSLAVAHTLLIIWGYAVTAHTNVVHQTGTLLTTYPDVLMATAAVGLLVAVGVTSARAARSRLRYETWHFIHLYTYLAVALAFSHQFSTGADFVTNRPARVLRSAMYIVVAALLFWFRVVRPVRQALVHRMRVVEVRRESPDTVSVWMTGHRLDELAPSRGSSSAGDSWPRTCGGRPIPIRSRRRLARLHLRPTRHDPPGRPGAAPGRRAPAADPPRIVHVLTGPHAMKRIVLAAFGTVAGLAALLSFKSHSALGGGAALPAASLPSIAPSTSPGSPSGGSPSGGSPSDGSPSATSTAPPKSNGSSTASGPRTIAGQAIDTRYGVVQVQVVVSGKKIQNVSFLQLTAYDPRSQEINSQAGPILLQQTLAAQSSQIDGVSGATFTSEGYVQSLQSALDQAGIP